MRQIDARLGQVSYGSGMPSKAHIRCAVSLHCVPLKGLKVQIMEIYIIRGPLLDTVALNSFQLRLDGKEGTPSICVLAQRC
jgi:hypothetical protein